MIDNFEGKYRFLSNFHEGDPFSLGGRLWPTGEHAYQAAKSLDIRFHDAVMQAATPHLAKKMGRKVQLREDWEEVKEAKMILVLEAKFAPGSKLAELLLETDSEELVEGNSWHDNIWGNCRCGKCSDIPGQNLLGKNLMVVRARLELL